MNFFSWEASIKFFFYCSLLYLFVVFVDEGL